MSGGLLGRGLAWTTGIVLMTALLIGAWAWMGRKTPTAAAGLQYPSLSYVPFGADQSLNDAPRIAQIEHDIELLSKVTRSIRIYSACVFGAPVLRAAERQRMTVWLGTWVSRDPVAARRELECGIRLARQFPTTVERLIVGNEAVTRKEITVPDLLELIDEAKASIVQPVGYADVPVVWETDQQLARHVEEMIVHLLPYWDSTFECGTSENTARGVVAYFDRMQDLFPRQRIIVGEVGWPTFGSLKHQCVPGRAFQADFLAEVARLAHERHITFNVIEAFDQRWKAQLEGVAGSQWGVFDIHRKPKADREGQVREDPLWRAHAGASVALMAAGIGAAFLLMLRYGIQLAALSPKTILMLCGLNAMASMASVLFWRQTYDLSGTLVAVLSTVVQLLLASVFSLRGQSPGKAGQIARDAQAFMKIAAFSMLVANLHFVCNPICHDVAIWAFLTPIATSLLAVVWHRFRVADPGFGSWVITLLNVVAVAKILVQQGHGNVQINLWLLGVVLIALPYLCWWSPGPQSNSSLVRSGYRCLLHRADFCRRALEHGGAPGRFDVSNAAGQPGVLAQTGGALSRPGGPFPSAQRVCILAQRHRVRRRGDPRWDTRYRQLGSDVRFVGHHGGRGRPGSVDEVGPRSHWEAQWPDLRGVTSSSF